VERLSFFFFLFFFSKRRKSAFTLIELLLVAALMVVIAGLSIPNLPRHLSVFQLDQATRHTSYLMRYAQSLAVVNQKEYRLCFSLDRLKYWVEEESADKEAGILQGALDQEKRFQQVAGEKGKIFFVPRGIAVEVEQSSIGFYPDGTIDRAVVVFHNKNQKKKMISTQERRGQIDVFSPSE